MWLPGASPVTVSGDTPRSCPSTETFAPGGSVRTAICPTAAVAFGISMNCETSAFAAMVNQGPFSVVGNPVQFEGSPTVYAVAPGARRSPE